MAKNNGGAGFVQMLESERNNNLALQRAQEDSAATNKIKDQYKAGKQEAQDTFKQYFGDMEGYTGAYKQSIDAAKARANQGMNAAEYAPIAENMRTTSKSLQSSLGSSGVAQGAFAGKMKMQNDRAFNIAKGQMDIQAKEANRKDYENKVGNVVKYGLGSMEQTAGLFASLEANRQAAQQMAQSSAAANSANQGGSKIICTELMKQGLLPEEVWEADEAYGKMMRLVEPSIYLGYITWAPYVVRMMKASRLFSLVFAYTIAIPWAKDMAYASAKIGNGSEWGSVISFVGEEICNLIGTIKLKWRKV